MKKTLPLLLIGVLFIAACSKKSTPAPPITTVITTPPSNGTVITFAGSGSQGSANGPQIAASFYDPNSVAVDLAGNVYVADLGNSLIREINAKGVVSTFAGSGTDSLANGTGTAASFSFPAGVAVDASYNVYVADLGNQVIRKISGTGVVTTLAGIGGVPGAANGAAASATFNGPVAVAVDASGNVYVADQNNNMIREISVAGAVTTLAGSGSPGFVNGTGTSASFNSPNGVAVDGNGNVYVADLINRAIRKITPAGVVTTFAGNGTGSVTFGAPSGVAVDGNNNIYVTDENTNLITMLTPAGVATTVSGNSTAGLVNGIGTAASFSFPTGVWVDYSGNIFIADRGNNVIRKIFE